MRIKVSVLILMISLTSKTLGIEHYREFIVWNVGQGLWTTLVDFTECKHFDMGGEFAPRREVKELCYNKKNSIYLSHEDWDHVGFAKQMGRILPSRCLYPLHTATKKYTRSLKFPQCSKSPDVQLLDLDFYQNSNESSRIIEVEGILLPGDSTIRMERIWSHLMKLTSVKVLLLGHHGSRTSTSQELLDRLPSLKLAIASARKKRYGHPHAFVRKRLRKNGIPLLRTEDWGHIRIRF